MYFDSDCISISTICRTMVVRAGILGFTWLALMILCRSLSLGLPSCFPRFSMDSYLSWEHVLACPVAYVSQNVFVSVFTIGDRMIFCIFGCILFRQFCLAICNKTCDDLCCGLSMMTFFLAPMFLGRSIVIQEYFDLGGLIFFRRGNWPPCL